MTSMCADDRMSMTTRSARVTSMEPLEGHLLALSFDDGASGVADVSDLLQGPVFEDIRTDDAVFRRVALDGYGSICWPNGADLHARALRDLTTARSTAAS